MAFLIKNLGCISTTATVAPRWWTYESSTDAIATISASGYFNTVMQDLTNGVGMFKVGDVIHIKGSDDYRLNTVTAVTTAVTVSPYAISSIVDGQVVTADLADNAVTAVKVYHNANGSMELADSMYFNIAAPSTGSYRHYAYISDGVAFNDTATGKLLAAATTKNYLLFVEGGRPVGQAMTGDSDDAAIKADYHNFAVNDASSTIRGLNISARNREGTVATIEGGNIGVKSSNGGTASTIRGLSVRAEGYAINATEFGVLDVNSSDEVGTATLRYALRVRNTDASAVTAMPSALLISSTATNGFTNAVNVQNACENFANFDDATGNVCTQTGSAATIWAGRVKVITPDGSAGYINVYSVSNA